ncbi:hypothetical protein GCM10012287_08210 [Streptomyces daqingensis]|uniref:Uncharacterized protein n=1 Tax=Streptomyces daqingensis TaxID=1472640 RepID=A0ABQ2LVL3_9ACTN|nr:hypothetical protein [Streptomyces daqingensis]GGO43910.1 hypothetical protein GCM10012287_08210 [Streptomyces daqingensis]
MARSSDIDFSFEEKLEVSAVVHRLMSHGASFLRDGRVTYVIDKEEMFDWQSVPALELERVLAIADTESADFSFGLAVFLDDRFTGGDLLFHPGHKTASFMVTINRKLLFGSQRFCDFGWYLNRLIPVFEEFNLTSFTASDYS